MESKEDQLLTQQAQTLVSSKKKLKSCAFFAAQWEQRCQRDCQQCEAVLRSGLVGPGAHTGQLFQGVPHNTLAMVIMLSGAPATNFSHQIAKDPGRGVLEQVGAAQQETCSSPRRPSRVLGRHSRPATRVKITR